MLATQPPPRMASGQPPSALPFGYSMDHPHDFLYNDAPEPPPPGDSLLTAVDERALDHFFEEMKSNDFDFHPLQGEGPDGLLYTQGWGAIPPQFMGVATSYGQQPSLAVEPTLHGLVQHPFHGNIITNPPLVMPPPPTPAALPLAAQPAPLGQPPPPPPPPPSAEMLAAADALQNAPLSRAPGSSHDPIFSREVAPSLGPHVGHVGHQSIADFRKESQTHLSREHQRHFAEMMFGTSGPSLPLRTNAPVDVNWGSDINFHAGRRFQPQSEKETEEALVHGRMKYLECLDIDETTRPASPVLNSDPSPTKSVARTRPSFSPADADEDQSEPPRKRRRSRAKDESDENDDEDLATGPRPGRKRKFKAEGRQPSPAAEGPRRRRKSASAANGPPKQPRENLTEAQKRENHIKSEQKRRTLIKQGFDDLGEIVPGLRSGGFSKSTSLVMATEFLAQLVAGNEELDKQLKSLRDQ